jgi:hypothetical protein
MLDVVDKSLERIKTLYEQYFLGIQKQPPTFLHTDIERKLRDLTQLQIRNTGLRYRFATLQQRFGAYNSYWRRTLRQIENGTYLRNLSKIGREAIRSGAEIPEEILAAMPKRMREQVVRDRDAAIAIAKRRQLGDVAEDELLTLADEPQPPEADEVAAMISEPSVIRKQLKTPSGAHILDVEDGDFDLGAFFAEVEAVEKTAPASPPPAPVPPPTAPVRPSAPGIPKPASSQNTRPIPVAPGAMSARAPVDVESMAGPFPRAPTPTVKPAATTVQAPAVPPKPVVPPRIAPPGTNPGGGAAAAKPPPPAAAPTRPMTPAAAQTKPAIPPPPPQRPPPGMTDADVNALYSKYIQAKQLVGEVAGPREREKLLKTINAQAPKIMEQYKAKGVDFSVVVKDNQVVIRAKPKT